MGCPHCIRKIAGRLYDDGLIFLLLSSPLLTPATGNKNTVIAIRIENRKKKRIRLMARVACRNIRSLCTLRDGTRHTQQQRQQKRRNNTERSKVIKTHFTKRSWDRNLTVWREKNTIIHVYSLHVYVYICTRARACVCVRAL